MNNLKRIIIVLLLFATTISYGQRRPDGGKIKSLKIAFITERLNLSSSEAEAFWPVYNAHEDKMNEFRKTERSEIRGKLRDLGAISDSEADKLLDKYIALEKEKSTVRQSFLKEIKGIISAKKTVLLMKAEEDFKKRLIQQYRKKRGGGGGPR